MPYNGWAGVGGVGGVGCWHGRSECMSSELDAGEGLPTGLLRKSRPGCAVSILFATRRHAEALITDDIQDSGCGEAHR